MSFDFDLSHVITAVSGFAATIVVMKRDLAELKKQVNGIGAKVNQTNDRVVESRIEIAVINEKLKGFENGLKTSC
jgi:hypothetical protein